MYAGDEAVFAIETGDVIDGKRPCRQTRLVQAWIEIQQEESLEDWSLAVRGQAVFSFDPLK